MSSPPPSKPKDPMIEAQIERTLAKFRGIATPAMLETMREELEEMLTTHPVAIGLMEQLRDHAAPEHGSGQALREGASPDDEAKPGKENA